MMRKHINQIDIKPDTEIQFPFYAWECLTLHLKHRTIDLVFPKEAEMKTFL